MGASIDNIRPMDWKLISATARFAPPLFVVSGLGDGHDLFYNFTAVFPKASHGQVHKQVRP